MARRFRLVPTLSASARVDRTKGIIFGVSAIQAVEALGHQLLVDATMLRQVAECGTGSEGVKSRFTHPGMCADGMGKQIGRAVNFRVVGDKTLCDLVLLEAAKKSPSGDLYSYVLDMAEQAPQDFGLSIVFEGMPVWKLADGTEVSVEDPTLAEVGPFGTSFKRPATATTAIPFARCADLSAVDVVDEPAANRDGLFSAAFASTTSALAEQAFAWLDEFRGMHGLGIDAVEQFVARYRATRASSPPTPAAALAADKDPMTPRLIRLSTTILAAFAPLILAGLAAKKSEEDIIDEAYAAKFKADGDAITALTTDRDAATAALAKAKTDHAAELAKLKEEHAAALAASKTKADELASQVARFKAFEQGGRAIPDVGGDPSTATPPTTDADAKKAWDSDAKLRAFFKNDAQTFADAVGNDGLAHVLKIAQAG